MRAKSILGKSILGRTGLGIALLTLASFSLTTPPAKAQVAVGQEAYQDAIDYPDQKFVKPGYGTITYTLTASGHTDNGKSGQDHIQCDIELTAVVTMNYDRHGEHVHRTVNGTRTETHYGPCDTADTYTAMRPFKTTASWSFDNSQDLPGTGDDSFGYTVSKKLRLGYFEGAGQFHDENSTPVTVHIMTETCDQPTTTDDTTVLDYRLPLHGAGNSALAKVAKPIESAGEDSGKPLDLTWGFVTESQADGTDLQGQYSVPVVAYSASPSTIQWNTDAAWKALENAGQVDDLADNEVYFFPGTLTVSWSLSGAPSCPDGEESGAQWVSRFPDHHSIADLAPGFQTKVIAFQGALQEAGAHISIGACRRPKERAYLMHYAWMIAHGTQDPATVPKMQGVAICWLHHDSSGNPDKPASIQAAKAMVAAYHMAYIAALDSMHIEGRAIDWTITWTGPLSIKKASGQTVVIPGPGEGSSNEALWAVGKSYGVIKLDSDAPHWSETGN